MNINLPDQSDAGAMCGPTVTVTSSSDGMSVEVGHGFGVTALTPAEWADLATKRGDQPYVLVDYGLGRTPYVSPLRTYADAMAEFNQDVTSGWHGDYSPHTGRSLRVMSQADYLKASKAWGVSDSDIDKSARRIDALRTAADLERDGGQQ